MNAFTPTPNAKILVDGGDPEETVRVIARFNGVRRKPTEFGRS